MAEPRWILQAVSGRVVQASFDLPLGVRVVAGRAADAPIRLASADTTASRYHAVFDAMPSGVTVIDLDSRNGILVNDEPMRAAILQEGDSLTIGDAVFRLVRHDAPPEPDYSIRPPRAVDIHSVAPPPPLPYVCEVCGQEGPTAALDHEPWWQEVAWICKTCAETRRSREASWPERIPEHVGEIDVLRFVACGATSAVFEGRHARAGCRVALKVMLPDRKADPRAIKRFVKEQQLASSLVHPAVARCFEVGLLPDGRPWIATEFLARGDVEALASNTSDVRMVLALAADLFDALTEAHARGVIHRDIKPANVLLGKPRADGTPRAKLTDFGLAKEYGRIGGTLVTKEDDIGGSAAFVAPEQLLGFKDVGPSADVYSAGATLYCLLTGEIPVVIQRRWLEATDPQLCLAALADERIPILERRAVHPWLAEWIDLLVCRDPQRRAHVRAADVAAMLRKVP
ncbi:MAG: protein kinase domain-containing protein [Polyangiales bacterium]